MNGIADKTMQRILWAAIAILLCIFILYFTSSVIAQTEIYGSFSLRPAKIEPNPFDWEIRTGVRADNGGAMYLRERQNGKLYYGYEYQRRIKGRHVALETDLFRRTEKRLSSQKVSLLGTFKVFGLGISGSWLFWKDGRLMGIFRMSDKIDNFTYQGEYSTNFDDRKLISGEIRYRHPFTKHIGASILGTYRNIITQSSQKTYQFKLELSCQL